VPRFPKIHQPESVYSLQVIQPVNRFSITRDHMAHFWPDSSLLQVVQEFHGCEADLLRAVQQGRLRAIYQEPAASSLSLEECLLRSVNARLAS
jgi:hypothetical protein